LNYIRKNLWVRVRSLTGGSLVYNHECYCSFLKEVVNESSLGAEFDEFRKTRNAVNYYGKEVTAEEAKATLGKVNLLTEKIKKQFLLHTAT
jgi:hypothetical protein